MTANAVTLTAHRSCVAAQMQEAAEMMSKLQDKPLVNQVSSMAPASPPQPCVPEGLMPSILQSGPDRMATPRGPHQSIDKFHTERSLDEVGVRCAASE